MTDETTNRAADSRDISVNALGASPWNTHHANIKDETFSGLVESIRHNGVIQRVACRILHDGSLEIIDGHRRVEAARAAGLETVPCDVYGEVSDKDAMAMTATANIQRLDNDPLLEAELIERMESDGMTRKQVAAAHMVIGVGKPVFDHHLCVVGAADAVCSAQTQDQSSADAAPSASISFCYAPDGYEFAQELNALVRILHDGLQAAPAECPFGSYGIHAYCRAVAALVMRDQTEWHRRKMEDLPI